MIKCLVTGGAGFIGSHVVDKLVDRGYEVLVIDNLSAESNEKFYFNQKAIYHELDICDYDNIKKLFLNVDYVFHLAAESRIQPAIKNPINAFYKNTIGTVTVLQCSVENNVKKVLYSSTSSAYGNNLPPNTETDVNDCLNPYSLSKVTGEDICKLFTNFYNLKTVIFRYFNVYGDRSPTKGQYAPVVGIFLKQKLQHKPLTIVGDGKQTRDFINVSDVADINIEAALSDVQEDSYGQIYNVGSGKNVSVLEIAKRISDNYTYISKRPGEAHTTLANIDKIKKIFNWKPKIDILEWINTKI